MGAFTDYLENKVLDHVFGKASYATNATVWIGLSTAAPNEGGTVTEIAGSGYARVAVPAANWSSASGGTILNASAVAFPGAGADWGTVSHFHAWDAASTGTMLMYGSLTANQNVPSGGTATFSASALKWTLD